MKILLVEDSADDRFWLSRLVSLVVENVELIEVTGAEVALSRLAEESFDLVLTDQNLPGLTGVELIRELREGANWTPVVVLSGRSSVDLASNSVEAGAVAYFSKDTLNTQTLSQGIELSQNALVRDLDFNSLDLDLPGMSERISERIMAPIAALKSDMALIRKRPNRLDDEAERLALDEMEAKGLHIEKKLQEALEKFELTLRG